MKITQHRSSLAQVMIDESCRRNSGHFADDAGDPRWHHIINSSQVDLPRNACANVLAASVVNELLTARSCLNWKKTSCPRVIPHSWLSKWTPWTPWLKLNVDRQQLELHNVDFGQLLPRSNPYHLNLLCVHLLQLVCSSVAAHPQFNLLRAGEKPPNSRPRIRGSGAEMALCVVSVRVSLHVHPLDFPFDVFDTLAVQLASRHFPAGNRQAVQIPSARPLWRPKWCWKTACSFSRLVTRYGFFINSVKTAWRLNLELGFCKKNLVLVGSKCTIVEISSQLKHGLTMKLPCYSLALDIWITASRP